MTHGWVTPLPDGRKIDCGGPEKCETCNLELQTKTANKLYEKEPPPDPAEAMQQISVIVTAYGPKYLNNGMPMWQACEAILLCLKRLSYEHNLMKKLLREGLSYSVFNSFISEETVAPIYQDLTASLEGIQDA